MWNWFIYHPQNQFPQWQEEDEDGDGGNGDETGGNWQGTVIITWW